MFGRSNRTTNAATPAEGGGRLNAAIRQARVELAERSSVVVDLRDAELARLEMLNDALDPMFAEIPPKVELFDRGISRGDTPRLWIDAIAYVAMGRDKREYRFVQDTRYGPKILAESHDIEAIVTAVTHYVATRLIERDRALAADSVGFHAVSRRGRLLGVFLLGLLMGCAALFGALWIGASRLPPQ